MEEKRTRDFGRGVAREPVKITLAVIAGMALAVIDYLIVVAAFLYRPATGEALFPAVALLVIAAMVLKQRWLVYLAQSPVAALILLRVFEPGERVELGDLPLAVLWIVLGYVLAWLIARAIPRKYPVPA